MKKYDYKYIRYIGEDGEVYVFGLNKKNIRNLIDKIVKSASYKVDGEYEIESEYVDKAVMYDASYWMLRFKKISLNGPVLPNGDLVYQDIGHGYMPVNGTCTEDYILKCSKIVVPRLAYLLDELMGENSNERKQELVKEFIEYENSDDFKPIEKEGKKVFSRIGYELDEELADEFIKNIKTYGFNTKELRECYKEAKKEFVVCAEINDFEYLKTNKSLKDSRFCKKLK